MYRYITTVAECKSISAAARRLYISQPALTKQISRLETQLGFKLFDRTKTPLSLTSAGELFVEFADRYVKLENELTNKLRLLDPSKSRCCYSCNDSSRRHLYRAFYRLISLPLSRDSAGVYERQCQ